MGDVVRFETTVERIGRTSITMRINVVAERADALRDVALDSLARVLGVDGSVVREQFVSWHFHDWSADPLARGAYSYVGVGGTDAWKALRVPIDDTIFIAGEATAGGGWNATMDGALESGSGRISLSAATSARNR